MTIGAYRSVKDFIINVRRTIIFLLFQGLPYDNVDIGFYGLNRNTSLKQGFSMASTVYKMDWNTIKLA